MQASVKHCAEEVRRAHGAAIRVRVGLNSGEVVVRAIGSDLHMDYTAVGQTTHLAARMEQLADPGSILQTPETLALAEGFVHVTTLGPVAVKGLAAPVEVYNLSGIGVARSRLQAAATRGLSRLVGRDAEIENLRRGLEQARSGRGQLIGVVGEPGVGKSRLAFELTHSHRVEGWLVLEAGSVSYGKATSYLPVIDLLKSYFRLGESDTHRDIREKVTGKLLTLDRVLEPTLLAFLALLDLPVGDPQWSTLDPRQRRQRTLDALKRLFLREAQVQPLLLVFEDLHWIDTETQSLLDALVESLPGVRVLLLVNYRPEYSHSWGSKTYYIQLRLDTLPTESTSELLDSLLGHDDSLQPLRILLAQTSSGNPLFLEESVRTLVETKALIGERGAYRLGQSVDTIRVPATVQAILASRIDRLPPEQKWLLETAAVIGKDFTFTLLTAIADNPEEQLRDGLHHLQAAESVYETNLFPDLEYTFKHALTHEVAYGSLLQERRRTLHSQIVEAIEALYPSRINEHVERLGQHAFRGEQWDKATQYLRQAGAKAAERSAHAEAISHLEQALKAVERGADGVGKLEQEIDLRISLRNSLHALGRFDRTLRYLSEAEALAATLGDKDRSGRVATYFSHYHWTMDNHDKNIEIAGRARELARDSSMTPLYSLSSFYMGLGYHGRGQYHRAGDLFLEAIESVESKGLQLSPVFLSSPSVTNRFFLAWSLAERGDFTQGYGIADKAIEFVAERRARPGELIHAYLAAGLVRLRKGDLAPAISWLERALQVSEAADLPYYWPWISCSLGYAFALRGNDAQAFAHLNSGIRQAISMNVMAYRALWLAYSSEGHLLAGRVTDARDAAERALSLSGDQKEDGSRAWALRMLGAVATRHERADPGQGEKHYRDAMTLAVELGMRPLTAHCHFGLGKLYKDTCRRDDSHEQLVAAGAMYREMDMTFWLSKAEKESAQTA
jgi:tetratricopeptide (TPR) repeat protein